MDWRQYLRDFLNTQNRQMSDRELDRDQAPLLQRRHGEPEIHFLYQKPVCFRPESEIRFHSGQHRYFENPKVKVSRRRIHGAHWKFADVRIAVERRRFMDRLMADLQKQPPLSIQALCARHMLDPELF